MKDGELEVYIQMSKTFKIIDRLKSFQFAFAGIWTLLKTQHNAWIHLAVTILVIGCGIYFGLSLIEWSVIVLAIMAVWVAEAFNTAVEFLADYVSTERHPLIKQAKDVAAGAVLITAAGAAIIGIILFYSHA